MANIDIYDDSYCIYRELFMNNDADLYNTTMASSQDDNSSDVSNLLIIVYCHQTKCFYQKTFTKQEVASLIPVFSLTEVEAIFKTCINRVSGYVLNVNQCKVDNVSTLELKFECKEIIKTYQWKFVLPEKTASDANQIDCIFDKCMKSIANSFDDDHVYDNEMRENIQGYQIFIDQIRSAIYNHMSLLQKDIKDICFNSKKEIAILPYINKLETKSQALQQTTSTSSTSLTTSSLTTPSTTTPPMATSMVPKNPVLTYQQFVKAEMINQRNQNPEKENTEHMLATSKAWMKYKQVHYVENKPESDDKSTEDHIATISTNTKPKNLEYMKAAAKSWNNFKKEHEPNNNTEKLEKNMDKDKFKTAKKAKIMKANQNQNKKKNKAKKSKDASTSDSEISDRSYESYSDRSFSDEESEPPSPPSPPKKKIYPYNLPYKQFITATVKRLRKEQPDSSKKELTELAGLEWNKYKTKNSDDD